MVAIDLKHDIYMLPWEQDTGSKEIFPEVEQFTIISGKENNKMVCLEQSAPSAHS